MAENLTKVPKRGILKASTSFEHREADSSRSKNPHFDETNILATLHPPDKDYGLMKIDEPKTPYEYASGAEEEENLSNDGSSGNRNGNQLASDSTGKCQDDQLDANLLAARIASEGHKGPRARRSSEPSADEEDLQLLSPEEREKRRKFEQKRKSHYNEFYAIKMARQLMHDSDEESEEGNGVSTSHQAAITSTVSTSEVQSSTTSTESSLDANNTPIDISNKPTHTKASNESSIANNAVTETCSSSVPMELTNSPPNS